MRPFGVFDAMSDMPSPCIVEYAGRRHFVMNGRLLPVSDPITDEATIISQGAIVANVEADWLHLIWSKSRRKLLTVAQVDLITSAKGIHPLQHMRDWVAFENSLYLDPCLDPTTAEHIGYSRIGLGDTLKLTVQGGRALVHKITPQARSLVAKRAPTSSLKPTPESKLYSTLLGEDFLDLESDS